MWSWEESHLLERRMLEPSVCCRFLAPKAFARAEAAARQIPGKGFIPKCPFPGSQHLLGRYLVLSEGCWVPAWL